ncbi:MAG: FixH family protein [Magnetococcus sp. YQC-5]
MMNHSTPKEPNIRTFWREPWLMAIVLFFVVVVTVNLILIRYSMLSWTGLVTEGAYVKGLNFNQVFEAQQKQDHLGWRVMLDTSKLTVGNKGELMFSLWDRKGEPLPEAHIQGMLFRPVHQGADQRFVMTEKQPGLYTADVTVPLPGQWDIKLDVAAPGGTYRYVQRIFLSKSE